MNARTRPHRNLEALASKAPTPTRGLALVVLDLDGSRTAELSLARAAELTADVDLHIVGRVARSCPISDTHRRRLHDLLELVNSLPDDVAVTAEIRAGDRYSVAVDAATEQRPTLIVIGGWDATGANLVAIADALSVPVLVARAPTSSGRIVAASNAKLELTPVLGSARRILGGTHASITLFHASAPAQGELAFGRPGEDLAFDQGTCARLLALQQLAPEARRDTVPDPVDAILEFAERRDVDVLTVGYRQRASFGCVRRHTTARIVDGCDCSVLVVPIARDLEAA